MKKVVFFLAVALMGLTASAQVTNFPWTESFDNGVPADFTLVDADGDGYNWDNAYWSASYAHSGSGLIASASYINEVGALSPDNWMILPAMTIPSEGGLILSWWARDYQYAENYGVFIGTEGTVEALSASSPVQTYTTDGSSTYSKKSIDLTPYAGQTIYIAFRHYNVTDMYWLMIDDIRVGGAEPPLLSADGPSLLVVGSQATYTANSDVTNLAWYVDGAQQSATGATFTTTFSVAGNHTVKVVATNAAGSVSDSVITSVLSLDQVTPRKTLLDHFTTAVCPNCPSAHTRLEQAIQGYEQNIVWVAHHVGYYTDDLTLSEDAAGTGIMGFYTGSSSFAPAMMLDRDPNIVPGEYNGIVGSVGYAATIQSQFDAALAQPSFVSVKIDNPEYNADSREISFDVTGFFTADVTGDIHVTVYIIEDSIMGSQSGASGQYRHDHVLRAVITDYWGDAITSTNTGDVYTKHYSYTVPATWKDRKCRLVAFVNRHGNDFYHRQVLNATSTKYLTDPTLDIENVKPAISVKMWPNPVAEMAFVEAESTIRSYVVVNAMGQRVMGAEGINAGALELNVSGLAAGVYFVSVTTDNGVSTERLSVVK